MYAGWPFDRIFAYNGVGRGGFIIAYIKVTPELGGNILSTEWDKIISLNFKVNNKTTI